MSTKTLRKRIALVAVSAMGFGLLTSVSANATTYYATTNASLAATNYCKAGTDLDSSAPRYLAVGARQVFTLSTADAGTALITGNAKWIASTANDNIDATGKKLTIGATGTYVLEVTGTGAMQVAWKNASATVDTFYFVAVSSCSTGYDAATSLTMLTATQTDAVAATNVDESAASTVGYASGGVQKSYLRINALNAYGAGIATSTSTNIASVTGGCAINFDETASTGTTTAIKTGVDGDTKNLVILNDNTPRSCTVTETLDGVVIATKTVKFTGDYATLEVTSDSSKYWAYQVDGSAAGATANKDAIVYVLKDSAGNVINPASSTAVTYVGLTNGFTQVTTTDGTYTYDKVATNGIGTLDVISTASTTVRGKGTYQLKITRRSDGVSVKSAVIDAEINKTPYTFTVAWDKPSYQIGDIMTLTITAKDSAGNMAYDGSTVGSDIAVSVGGTTTLTTPTSTDSFLNGVKKYKFTAGTTAANYGYSVAMTTGSAQDPVTGTISIAAPAGGVTNAEVLAAIVNLIASINKQIAALQKALTKKK